MSSIYAMRLKSMARTGLTAHSGLRAEHKTGHKCRYNLLEKIGEGTYGTVFKALDVSTGRVVAIKRIAKRVRNESVIRNEIELLTRIRHKNIIELNDKYETSEEAPFGAPVRDSADTTAKISNHFLVFEFCDFDLHQILYELHIPLTFGQIKNILQQILEGIAYIHDCQVIHRDIKPENILLNRAGRVQIADFGFAQCLHRHSWSGFSSKVVTLAYRAPELLVGYRFYGTAIDMWSIGCILAEFWTRGGPLMMGADEYQQLILISRLCGPINSNSLLGVNNMYFMSELYLPQFYQRKVKQFFGIKCSEDTLASDLFDQLLALNINDRISARNALNHKLFASEPKPSDISQELQNFYLS